MFTRKPDARDGQPGAWNETAEPPVRSIGQPERLSPSQALRTETPRAVGGASTVQETIISADLTIVGNVISKGRVRLEGTIEGDMHCASLEVSQSGAVTGTIVAEDVAVYGKVAGTVRGKSVMLYSSAHVEGDVYHTGIGIEMGTHYDGRLKWAENPLADAPPTGVLPRG